MLWLHRLVLRAEDPDLLKDFYRCVGLDFVRRRHGAGPTHWAATVNGIDFEIYPQRGPADSTSAVRLGLMVPDVELALAAVFERFPDTVIVGKPFAGDESDRTVVEDPAGHVLELSASGRP